MLIDNIFVSNKELEMEIFDETKLKRAVLEDELVDLILKHHPDFVMHGGTTVWRCYGGARFSRDIDFYSNLGPEAESAFQKEFHKVLTEKGYSIREEKYNNKTKTLHIIVRGNNTTGKLDITFSSAEGVAVDYLKTDGAKRLIRALSPEALLNEKISTYLNKHAEGMHEIQDLYDMVVLKTRLDHPPKSTIARLSEFLAIVRNDPPKDEASLKGLILSGIAPTFVEMLDNLGRWVSDHSK